MSLIENIISIIAPHTCLVCGTEGELVCNWCRPDACPLLPSRCYKCYKMTQNSQVCDKCRRTSPLKYVWVCTDYQGVAKQLVYKYKLEQARSAGQLIAEFMGQTLPYLENSLMVPIPTATTHIRSRGFDHSQLLAKNLSAKTRLPINAALSRLGQAKQVGNKRRQRKQQLKNTFWVRSFVEGKQILLIDDVVTTGATLEEAARTLKKAGAKTVNAVVFAQKL